MRYQLYDINKQEYMSKTGGLTTDRDDAYTSSDRAQIVAIQKKYNDLLERNFTIVHVMEDAA